VFGNGKLYGDDERKQKRHGKLYGQLKLNLKKIMHNESRNNSILSTIIFLCLATLAVLAITLASENFTPQKGTNTNNSSAQTK
jgi:hypothetical protein